MGYQVIVFIFFILKETICTCTVGNFSQPISVMLDPKSGSSYVTNSYDSTVVKYSVFDQVTLY